MMKHDDFSTLAVDNQDNICYISDPVTYELLYLNRKARELTGIDGSLAGQKCYEVLQGKDAPCEFCTNHLLEAGKSYCWEFHNLNFDKMFSLRDTLVESHGRKLRLEWGVDVTERRKEAAALTDKLLLEETLIRCIQTLSGEQDTQAALDSLLAIVGEYYAANRAYIFEFDFDSGTINNTHEWRKEGVSAEIDNLQGIPLSAVEAWMRRFEQDGAFFISCLHTELDPQSLDYQILEPQGIESLMAAPLIQNGRISGFLGVDDPSINILDDRLLRSVCLVVQEDLEKRRMLSELERMSYMDILTGLGNRNKYTVTLQALEQNPLKSLGVVYLDINGLKAANDMYGHSYGDHLISRTAELLKDFFHNDVFRTGGDEFVVLCRDIERERFEAMLDEFRSRAENEEGLKLSIGGNWRKGEFNIREQIVRADELMYIDKQNYYKSLPAGASNRRAGEVQQLLDDIAAGMFVVHLQPQVELRTEKVVGAEALVRRREASGELLAPAGFIPTYEKEGIIRHLDFFVLETVCSALRCWKRLGFSLPVAVNFSRMTLLEHNVVNRLLEICARYNVEPGLIRIEVTESLSRIDTPTLKKLVSLLRDEGFAVSLDDFGTQHSNLAILTNIDFNEIKFDRSLVSGLGDTPKSGVIMEHAIGMCHAFRRTASLAEGVETPLQKDILKDYHCRYGQGFLFGKPMSMDEFWDWYQQRMKEESEEPERAAVPPDSMEF